MNTQEINRIVALSNAFGPSGMEDEVSNLVQRELEKMGLSSKQDCLRNVRAVLNPDEEKPRIMLDSHLDEVGIIVQAIKPNGTMTFLPLGGWVSHNLPNSRFVFMNKRGEKVRAVVASQPPHFMKAADRNQAIDVSQLVLDCGATSLQEAKEVYGLGIGCFGVPDVTCDFDEKTGIFSGKAFDCRIGVAAELETLARLQNQTLECVVQASFPSQEEVGERGAGYSTRQLNPNLAICFEGCPADDTFQEEWKIQAAMGKGPMLRDFDVSMITSPRFEAFAFEVANEFHIPVQESVRSGGGTDGGKIHLDGIPCIVIGIPVRYIHASYCYCKKEDYEHAVDLAVAIVQKCNAEVIASF